MSSNTWYCTREDVKSALDYAETALVNGQVDRAIDAASRSVEGLTHRRFAPVLATRYFNWPNPQRARSWRLWLDQHEAISLTSLTSGGVAIAADDYFLEPVNDGPPYNCIEIDLASSAAWSGGATHQQSIAATGLWGYSDDETTVGTLTDTLDAAETTVDVDGPASALLGVGSVLRADAERMSVTGRSMTDTGQTTGAALDDSAADVAVTVTDGAAYATGEVLLIGSERMLVVDIAGNTATVKRAWDGSVLAGHDSGAAIYAARTLTVRRGALGTAAATHDAAAPVHRWDPPGPVRELVLAEAENMLIQGQSGYARTVGGGESERESSGRGIRDLRMSVYTSHGRKARSRAV